MGVNTKLAELKWFMDTKQEEIKLLSLNVNSLRNPVKRAKIKTKLGKTKQDTAKNFPQETHLLKAEYEKLKRFGFKNTF